MTDTDTDTIRLPAGRQLFVDDFLVSRTNLSRQFHAPQWYGTGPVLRPETEVELNGGICPVATPFQDGVFYDPIAGHFKMYYMAGWMDGTALAISQDGIHWERPDFGIVPGTNLVLPPTYPFIRDGASMWMDHKTANPAERYKMFVYFRKVQREDAAYGGAGIACEYALARIYTSPDGINWIDRGETGECGDNTSFFYNPFRRSWFYSVRTSANEKRARSYREAVDFVAGRNWTREDLVLFSEADAEDQADPVVGEAAQMYNVDAVAYESVMLGLFAVHRGPSNAECFASGNPKITDLELGFSRDEGLTWTRPDRGGFLNCTRNIGDWNSGYLHAASGVCLVVGDKLHFYVGGFSGVSPKLGRHYYAGGSTGLATLRRDGFASMTGSGELVTRPLTISRPFLFVNADAGRGELHVSILDRHGAELPGFGEAECRPLTGEGTAQQVTWSRRSLGELAGQDVRIRFNQRNTDLYAFWFSPSERGESLGFVAAGGPEFKGVIDA
jgi:hypothetical protein